MHLHLLLLTTFLCSALAQKETSRDGLVESGETQPRSGQPDQQQQLGFLSDPSLNKDANERASFIFTQPGVPKSARRKKPANKETLDTLDGEDYEYDIGFPIASPSSSSPLIDDLTESPTYTDSITTTSEYPDISYSPETTTSKSDVIKTTTSNSDATKTTVSKTTVARTTSKETNGTTTVKTTTVATSLEPSRNDTTTPKPSKTGKSIWRSPLVIWIAIIVLAIIVLAVQMPTILYLLCCRNQTQTSEVLLSDGKDFQRPPQSMSVNQAQTVTQQQLKSSTAMPIAPMASNTARPPLAKKFIPTLGIQQQQKQNDTAAMSDAFGTSMNSDAESGFANAPITSAAIRAKANQMLPKISYTASTDQKMSSTSTRKNQAGKPNGKSKKAASRR